MSDERTVIAIDFDDTIVKRNSHDPADFEDCGAVPWLLAMQQNGARLILWTCRTTDYGLPLAVGWLAAHGLYMEVNSNATWELALVEKGTGRKVFADLYIDDKGLGVPLREDGCVDWDVAGPRVIAWLARR